MTETPNPPPSPDRDHGAPTAARLGGEELPPERRRWPRWLRRGPMELLATVLIAAGVAMLMQPFALWLFTYSFFVILVGTVGFIVVSHFPE